MAKKIVELDFVDRSEVLSLTRHIGNVEIPTHGKAEIVNTPDGLFWEVRLNGVNVGVDIKPVLNALGNVLEARLNEKGEEQ